MPEVTVTIGERSFSVACQAGEEHFLISAAKMVDAEAMSLLRQIGRMPELRMLLMSSLLLADKTAAMEDQVRQSEARIANLQAELDSLRGAPAPVPMRVEVPVLPVQVLDMMAEIAARAEALAERVEGRLAG